MIRIGFLILTLAALGGVEAVAEAERRGVVRLDETVISGNQELPKVLYIVPWKDPDDMPGIELEPEFTELQVFRRLYPPAYRRELNYYELLNAVETEE